MTADRTPVSAGILADEQSPGRSSWSVPRILLFWWGLYLVIQQAGRLFLLPEALSIETPSAGVLATTLVTGLRADLIVATLGVVLGMAVALALWLPHAALSKLRGMPVNARVYGRGFAASSLLIAVLLMGLVTVDMGYYAYNHAHLDFVFLEYVDDLFAGDNEQAKASEGGPPASQALQQTEAELKEVKKWGWRLFGFIILQGAVIIVWWQAFRRIVEPAWARWESTSPRVATVMVVLGLTLGATGIHPDGPWSIARVGINSSVYYILAQNPLWYTGDVLFGNIAYRRSGRPSTVHNTMPFEDAVRIAGAALAQGGTFPFPRYPFVRETEPSNGVRLEGLPNVLLIFVEGLDRRYLDRTIVVDGGAVQGIRVTPFLDRLRGESVFFEHFFSNGAQTHHGLFASFCSYYARYGRAAIKALYTYDYLCLPTVLRESGYQTEMVIGQNRDHHQDHTALFMARNGLNQLFDESDFPPRAERLGLGMTDAALFDFVRVRIENLKGSGRPYFLATLTLGTHHPFTVPQTHPDVRALQGAPDRYLAALRCLDLELERFFAGLQRDGLLKNTVVFILGDHGRHERVGQTQT
ncbi:MAG: LTA synthase family protein, partial [Candidatus Methylomirabilales bacterium]